MPELFTGVVEEENDPLQKGRVKVRVFEFHEEDKTKLLKLTPIQYTGLASYLAKLK